jgi:hypothetical protein
VIHSSPNVRAAACGLGFQEYPGSATQVQNCYPAFSLVDPLWCGSDYRTEKSRMYGVMLFAMPRKQHVCIEQLIISLQFGQGNVCS